MNPKELPIKEPRERAPCYLGIFRLIQIAKEML